MKRIPGALVALALVIVWVPATNGQQRAAFTPTAVRQPAMLKSADTITAKALQNYLGFVASDEMEGRATPSRGLDTTAKFIATELTRAGVKPAGDGGTYFQQIALRKDKLAPEGAELEINGQKQVFGKDFYAASVAGTAAGPLVFAGDGWFIKAKSLDAYQGIDPKGKVVILTQGGLPKGFTFADLAGGKRGEDWIDPASYAQKRGAIGIIALPPLVVLADQEAIDRTRAAAEAGAFAPEKLPRAAQGQLPTVVATLKVARLLFAREKTDVNTIMASFPNGTPVKPFELSADKKVRLSVKTIAESSTSQNVVALVEGSDPTLKNEFVALGAHYDHSGTRQGGSGDTIMNGADDDGTGTVALLAMAEALAGAQRRPKRSVVFVWHMGEEMGLWGSQYFATFPTVPIDKIVAQLNIDMIGRSRAADDTNPRDKDLSGPNEVYVIGSKMMSTELGNLSEAVNAAYLKLSFNYKYDDPKDPERFFYRSDHINYARKNIPIIFYFTGVHADYHQPSDEVSKIDFQKYEKITRTIYATLWEIGELKSRPKVDKELPAAAKQDIF